MAKRKPKRWMYSPKSLPKPKVPDAVKQEVAARCDALVESVLKPEHIKPPPENPQFNYIVDLYNKWYRSFFYFCAKYASPGPYAIAPFFELKYTRLEYVGGDRFNLAYMRHTNQWQEVYQELSLDECLETIRKEALFWP